MRDVQQPDAALLPTAVIDGEIKTVSMSEALSSKQWTVLLFYPKASGLGPCAGTLLCCSTN